MSQGQLRFVTADDPELDDLTQEAWLENREIADLRRVDGEWRITFFPSDQFCELTWETLTSIYESFAKFKSESPA